MLRYIPVFSDRTHPGTSSGGRKPATSRTKCCMVVESERGLTMAGKVVMTFIAMAMAGDRTRVKSINIAVNEIKGLLYNA